MVWKRLASAASFSMCLRYSSIVVAADALEFAARQRGLEHIGGIHGAFGRARADNGVELVDKQDDIVGAPDFLHHRLEPLLELAAVFRARYDARQVEREHAALQQQVGHVAFDDGLGQPSTMAVLPTPASPMSTGLFFVRRLSTWMTRSISSARPITGSSLLSRASSVRSRPKASSAGVCDFLLVCASGVRLAVALRAQKADDLRLYLAEVHLHVLQNLGGDAFAFLEQAQQDVLRADIAVIEAARLLDGQLEHLFRARGKGDVVAAHGRRAHLHLLLDFQRQRVHLDAEIPERRAPAIASFSRHRPQQDVLGAHIFTAQPRRFLARPCLPRVSRVP